MKIWIDPYGRRRETPGYRTDAPMPCEVDGATDGVKYLRYGSGAQCPIVKVTTADNVTAISWAYGAWANRASIATWVGIDIDIEIDN